MKTITLKFKNVETSTLTQRITALNLKLEEYLIRVLDKGLINKTIIEFLKTQEL